MTHPSELDLGPLTWVKNEIDLALTRADESLEQALSASDAPVRVQFALTHLHQVRGALSIVGLDGLTQFASSLDQSLGLFARGERPIDAAAITLARRALATMGNYLEELVHGTPDQPLRLLPLYREIGAIRNTDPVSPAELFFPDLTQRPPRRQLASITLSDDARLGQLRAQRALFQRGLLQWLRTANDPAGPAAMLDAVKGMEVLHTGTPVTNLWYAAQAFLEALVNGDLRAQPEVKRLCSQLDAQLKRLAEVPAAVPERFIRELLYWTAQAPARTAQQQAVRDTWHPHALIPEAGSTVSVTPLAPLLRSLQTLMAATKHAWDEFSEGHAAALPRFASSLADLAAQAPQLGRPALDRLLEALIEFVRWLRKDPLQNTDKVAIEVATALLLVEGALDRVVPDTGFSTQVADTVSRLGAVTRGEAVEPAEHSPTVETARRLHEREAVGQLAREILSSLAQVEQILDDFFRNQQKRAPLTNLATPLKQVEGALTLIGDPDAIALVHDAATTVARLAETDATPESGQFEGLAQRLSALGFYVQALQHGPASLQPFLDPATRRERTSAEAPALRIDLPRFAEEIPPAAKAGPAAAPAVAPIAQPFAALEPAVEESAAAPDVPATAASEILPAEEATTEPSVPIEEVETDLNFQPPLEPAEPAAPEIRIDFAPIELPPETPAPAPAAPQAAPASAPVAPAPSAAEIDAELLEIFIEEAHEVLANVAEQLDLLRTAPGNVEHLTSIRRGFHTLKGSGRMVGLRDLGEAAWGVEQTLNRWLQLEWPPTPALHHLLGDAGQVFSEWVSDLEAGGNQARDVAALMAEAERLRGSDTPISEPAPQAIPTSAAEPVAAEEAALGFATLEQAESGEILPVAAPAAEEEIAVEESLEALELEDLGEEIALEALEAGEGTESAIAIEYVPETSPLAALETAGEIPLTEETRSIEELSLEPGAEQSAEHEPVPAPVAEETFVLEELEEAPSAGIGGEFEFPLELGEELPAPPAAGTGGEAATTAASEDIELPPTVELAAAAEEQITLETPPEFELPSVVEELPSFDETVALEQTAGVEAPLELPETTEAAETERVEELAELEELAEFEEVVDLEDTIDLEEAVELEETLPAETPAVAGSVDLEKADALEMPLVAEGGVAAEAPEEPQAPAVVAEDIEEATVDLEETEAPIERDVVYVGDNEISRPLYDLYLGEARHHLGTLRDELRRLAANPTLIPAEAALRAAHTLAGISGTTRLMSVQALARALEHAIERLRESAHPPTEEQSAVMKSSNDTLEAMVAQIALRQMPLEVPELTEQLDGIGRTIALDADFEAEVGIEEAAPERPSAAAEAAEGATHAATVADDLDEQLLPVFLDEGAELLADLHATLRRWSSGDASSDHAKATARLLHTLKGSARMAGAMSLGEHVHQLESQLEAGREAGRDAVELMDELLGGLDHTERMMSALTGAPAPVAATTSGAAEVAVSLAAPETVPTEGEGSATATLRVRADTVDRFVNEAGEIGIARTRIAGELRTLRRSLLDLTENVIRLRNQLREVEIQADVQMQSRIAHTGTHEGEFDPLEMDRYTRLQELTRMMAESVGDVTTVQQSLLRNLDGAELALSSQARLSRDLQQALMQVRMVPFDSLADRLYRVTRQTAKDLGKRANLDLRGGRIEIDRSVLEHITAPLEHLLRNAIAHGIENPDVRRAGGKNEIGQITLSVSQEGNEIAISLSDDGSGLDYERIAERARAHGLLGPAEIADERRLTNLIFLPGFSTASNVSTVSGRGVGMDVVKSETAAVGGRIDIRSTHGAGTEFRIYLPLTLAVTQALLVSAGGRTFAIPSSMVAQVLELKVGGLQELRAAGGTDWQDIHFNYRYLPRLLGDPTSQPEEQRFNWVLLLRAGAQTLALHVDALRGNQEIVVKNAGPQLARVVGISGATVLGDGEIVLILNPVALASRGLAETAESLAGATPGTTQPAEAAAVQPTVMVVDDSLTVRKITGRLLEREGYRVITAKDGVDALERLIESVPDLILSDIEMPRMDGFDLLRNIRSDARTRDVPVIMITSRLADKHRQLAEKIGANEYLGKPYEEGELLALLQHYTAKAPVEA
ncbi:hybrid sensor histidine kinase/response regulator [Aromatoleum toluclasticum]|uniref:hybrid sensor histidine kinase/response regulator n=1 Tax=Aromatoleum toluclasticum TaxID=92003 RepID=UPI000376710F|nr:Hpt domain-containing protein [Aromatoleum toluclasticum]